MLFRYMNILEQKEQKYGSNVMRELERICLLRNVDSKWMDHIDAMDQLKQGITLRGDGQHDPVVEYRIEGFEMFDAMVDSIREDTVRMLLNVEIRQNPGAPTAAPAPRPAAQAAPAPSYSAGSNDDFALIEDEGDLPF